VDPAYEARLERLKAVRNQLAQQYDLAPGVLCPNGTLEAIARANPATPEQLAATPELRRWQLAEFGEKLLGAVRGGGPTPSSSPTAFPSPAGS
jgi:ribonuclease D